MLKDRNYFVSFYFYENGNVIQLYNTTTTQIDTIEDDDNNITNCNVITEQ